MQEHQTPSENRSPTGDEFLYRRKVLASHYRNIERAVDWMEELAREQGVDEELMYRLLLATSEAVTNSLHHGNQYDPIKDVVLEATFADMEIAVVVEDEGMGFQPAELDDPLQDEHLKREGGRGVYLIEQLADAVEYGRDGCRVTMHFEWE